MATRYSITQTSLHLYDASTIKKREIDKRLNSIQALHPKSRIWERGRRSLRREWAAQKALFRMGINRERTKDCVFRYPQPFSGRFAGALLGSIAWVFLG